MGFRGRLEITDGTTFIDLLGNSGGSKSIFGLLEWEPAAPDVKAGGIWMDNPLLDGRQLAIRKESNIIETFSLVAKGQNANDIHNAVTRLRYMLNRAVGYWTNRARYPDPIYILIQYPEETEPYWALIYDYRLPQLTNPFIQPLYGKKAAIIPEFTLIVERGLRSPVTGISCAVLNFLKSWFVINSVSFSPSDGTDDCEVDLTNGAINTAGTIGEFGTVESIILVNYGIGVRFRNVTVPIGATIKRVYFIIDSAITITGSQPILLFDGELNVAPAAFSTYANYIARARTTNKVHITKDDYQSNCTTGFDYNIPKNIISQGLEEIVQEIIDLPGWASGNDLVLFIEPDEGNIIYDYRLAGMFEHAVFDPIRLRIEWSDPSTSKVETIINDDCTPVFLTNQLKPSQINTVQRYNATAGTYTVLSGTAMPWTLISQIAVNSAVYFACNLTSNFVQYYSLVINLSEAFSSEITIVWETYNGGVWVAATDLVDGSNGLKNLGTSVIHWTPSSQMVFTTINGIQGTYIRARITAVGGGSATVPIHSAVNEVLTPGYPYIDITDIPLSDTKLPFQIIASPVGSGISVDNYTLDELWISICDLNKKRNFLPFINITSNAYERPDGISITTGYGYAALYTSPARLGLTFIEAGVQAETDVFSLDFDNTATPNYYGKFRVFLRRLEVLDPENASYRLRLTTDTAGGLTPIQYQTDLIPDTNNPGYSIIDFGTLNIPQNLSSFHLIVSGETSAACEVKLTDMILLPVDEMFIRVYQRTGADVTAWEQVYDDTSIVIDSTDGELKAWIQRAGLIASSLMIETNGDIAFDPLKDYRLWFFAGTYTDTCTNYQRQYWPGLDYSVIIKFLKKVI